MEPSRIALFVVVFLPFLAAATVPLVYRVLGERTAYFAAAVAAVCLGILASQFGTEGTVSMAWIPALDVSIRLYVDGLSLLIGLLASGIGILILTYSGGYMHGEPGQPKYYAALLAFMGSMLGLVFAADLIALFLFWELTSLSSFILIGHYQRAEASRYAARKSMLITVAGGLFMLVGFLLLHLVSGDVASIDGSTYNLFLMLEHADEMGAALRDAGLYVPVLALVGIGAAAKSAQVPLHVWLPNAMEAPTPVSAFLHSATMVKAGVYLVGRLRPLLAGDPWFLFFVSLGLVTMTVAAVLAVAASDIKELLAYSTASHLGLIIAGFGFAGFAGEEAALLGGETGGFHILNHALFKAALFLVAGIVAHEAGTRALDELGGLRRDLPITAGIAAITALGMAGIPPFNGFYSKEFLFEAAYAAGEHVGGIGWLIPAVAVLGSVFTFLYSIRFLALFFGDRPDALGHVHRPPLVMLVPPALLAVLALAVGLGGVGATVGVHLSPVESFLTRVFESVAIGGAHGHEFSYHLPTKAKPAALMSAVTIALGVVSYPAYDRIRDGARRALAVDPLRADWYYDGAVEGLTAGGAWLTPRVQTGLLRTYAFWALGTTSALTLGAYLAAGVGLSMPTTVVATLPIVLVLAVAVVSALAVARAPSHVAGVLTLSILGFMVAIFYILTNAPDLALTQLVVETLVLVIFLLVLDRLPAFYGEATPARSIRDGLLSLAVGATVTVTVLLTTSATPDNGIASYFIKRAPADHDVHEFVIGSGGGSNIVNVILVDFRAFDTLGEISVVGMAALSILTLIGMRGRGGTHGGVTGTADGGANTADETAGTDGGEPDR
ncbi:MAG: hydrogen gas-evolving membrane-bound hydrogenase subunit E [Halobacteriales archaeon]